jgi:predicted phosphohydrolase
MVIWAIADLHLSFGVKGKSMDIFGEKWKSHALKIEQSWKDLVHSEDLVLIAGDISWAMNLQTVKADFEWLEALPGTKVMIKGNHDYWWSSVSKVRQILPPSCHVIYNDAFLWNDVAVGGSRLWESYEYHFDDYILFEGEKKESASSLEENEKIFIRELQRLETSLKAMSPFAKKKIALTHYPPISADLKDSRVSSLLEHYHIDYCIFGHLHNLKQPLAFGIKGGVHYILSACDELNFQPQRISDGI